MFKKQAHKASKYVSKIKDFKRDAEMAAGDLKQTKIRKGGLSRALKGK